MNKDMENTFNRMAELGGSDERLGTNTAPFINAPLLPKNTRPAPAATDTGLVTYAHDNETLSGLSRNEHGPWCLRSQAEELLAAKDARIKELEEYAREATKAITGLTSGGSEYFGKEIGDVFTADLPYCLKRIRERYVSKVELKRLEAKLEAARKALEEISKGETTTYDEDVGTDVSTWLDEEEMQSIARAALEDRP